MNKMFTATAILQRAGEGKVDLSAPFGKYLTAYPSQNAAARVTIRELLTHAGGMGDIFTPEYDQKRLEVRELKDYVKLFGSRPSESSRDLSGIVQTMDLSCSAWLSKKFRACLTTITSARMSSIRPECMTPILCRRRRASRRDRLDTDGRMVDWPRTLILFRGVDRRLAEGTRRWAICSGLRRHSAVEGSSNRCFSPK